MHRPRFLVAVALALLSIPSAIVAAVDRGIAFAFAVLARPTAFVVPTFVPALAGGPAPSYDVPPLHELRHEAGQSKRSAARNV